MSLKKKLASALAVGALALGGLMISVPAAHATGNPSKLDQGDLSLACKMQYGQNGWIAKLLYPGAYGWRCVYNNNNSTAQGVSVNSYCQAYWGVWATATNPNDPYSWKCQGY